MRSGVQKFLFKEFVTVIGFSTFEYFLPDDDQQLDDSIDITIFLDMFLGMQVTSDLSIPFYTSEKWWMADQEAGALRNSALHHQAMEPLSLRQKSGSLQALEIWNLSSINTFKCDVKVMTMSPSNSMIIFVCSVDWKLTEGHWEVWLRRNLSSFLFH